MKPKNKRYVWTFEFEPATEWQEELNVKSMEMIIRTMWKITMGRHQKNKAHFSIKKTPNV
jgi:hypothetical protein